MEKIDAEFEKLSRQIDEIVNERDTKKTQIAQHESDIQNLNTKIERLQQDAKSGSAENKAAYTRAVQGGMDMLTGLKRKRDETIEEYNALGSLVGERINKIRKTIQTAKGMEIDEKNEFKFQTSLLSKSAIEFAANELLSTFKSSIMKMDTSALQKTVVSDDYKSEANIANAAGIYRVGLRDLLITKEGQKVKDLYTEKLVKERLIGAIKNVLAGRNKGASA